jgi:hypothetical protein
VFALTIKSVLERLRVNLKMNMRKMNDTKFALIIIDTINKRMMKASITNCIPFERLILYFVSTADLMILRSDSILNCLKTGIDS